MPQPAPGAWQRPSTHHVGLPPFDVDAAVDAPPEVVFGFSLPGEDGEPWHREGDGCSHSRARGPGLSLRPRMTKRAPDATAVVLAV